MNKRYEFILDAGWRVIRVETDAAGERHYEIATARTLEEAVRAARYDAGEPVRLVSEVIV